LKTQQNDSYQTSMTVYKQGIFVFLKGKQLARSTTDSSVSIRTWRRKSCPVQVNVVAYMQVTLPDCTAAWLLYPSCGLRQSMYCMR